MKIGVVYTGISPTLLADINSEIGRVLPGADIMIFSDPSLLSECIANGVTRQVEQRLVGLYWAAAKAGADIVYNVCSSVGDVADDAAPLFAKMGLPLIRIDEKMASDAVAMGKKIGIVATLNSTLEPTKRLVARKSKELDKDVEIVDILVDGAYGKPPDVMNTMILEKVAQLVGKVDVILLAQASMNPCHNEIVDRYGLTAFASPVSGADYLKQTADLLGT